MRCFRRPLVLPFAILAAMIMLAGCSSLPRTPYTVSDAASSTVLDLGELRRYADEPASTFLKTNLSSRSGPLSYLALSGGGADGAYGAGVLNGWTAAGTRPEFSVVSGVSTGALIAPFAFLGPAYDATLRDIYTSGIAESLLNTPNIVHALFGSGLFGNTHLRELVARYVGQDMLAAIAAEDAKGRRLLIVTTNLDTQRTVIWDMGRIARIGSAQALDLFRDVLAASASIPVVFPPMLIEAEANGHRFQEMHVDGGVTAPVLTLPEAFLLRNGAFARGLRMNIYVLVNDKVERDFQLVPNSTIDIAARASASVTKTQIRSVLYETYDFARRNNFGFNLTYVDKDIPSPGSFGFDTGYMRSLYQYGYDKARTGDFWAKAPPSDDFLQNGLRYRRSATLQ
ncbi:patatin-like phospholipase family protein [Bradyrhizobium canariense]|uniref:Patatin-like phospholipase n=1 Tax=Bradyrhizobium canariense TaxID=255045 RepID=A0A1H2AFP4_9BRAD|nr:patatin-like phospholipase family protein [Bradyrhizobium canariense]SDT44744.1 Patatin-like phospholipase [Bradyrhizobium canariense]